MQTSGDEEMAWGKRFYMKGGFLAALSEGFVDLGLERGRRAGRRVLDQVVGSGRCDRARPDDAMAFTGREAPYWLGVEAAWDDPSLDDAHLAWGRVTMDALSLSRPRAIT